MSTIVTYFVCICKSYLKYYCDTARTIKKKMLPKQIGRLDLTPQGIRQFAPLAQNHENWIYRFWTFI